MTKTQKNLDKAIRRVLTSACEIAKDDVMGFAWLTHQVDLQKPTNTLKVSCYFSDETALSAAKQNNQLTDIEAIIKSELRTINLAAQAVTFSTD